MSTVSVTDEDPMYLYRVWDDDDTLLYVGITVDIGQRFRQHSVSAHWLPVAARAEITRYASPAAAKRDELAAIRTEGPVFNRQGRRYAERAARIREYRDGEFAHLLLDGNKIAKAPNWDIEEQMIRWHQSLVLDIRAERSYVN